MNITNLNAHALMNTAKSLIEMLRNNKKATISKVVTEWNICVEQSGYTTTFDFPVEGWTRKAQVIADLERCAAQLEELAFAVEAEDFVAVDEVEEVPVVDIKAGMWVQNPLVLGQFQQVEEVSHIGNDLITIRFSWNMGTQTFVYGETLTVRASNNDAQTPNVLTKPEGSNMYFSELFVSEQFRDLSDGKIYTKTAQETGVINAIESNGNTATFFAEDEVERA
ncbi:MULTISPECIES: hypothetical protein [Klebsiella]|uniref:hypothetical protein n=1 Tax=Klebsiella TaxID=570 RepID=UPI000B420813|nr:hypothetical protein [Klebsiella pneumoniae]ELA2285381.1 hypothetical protein [Klebsiella pneumoniae]ELA2484983.1 hypothetical protein [Klebsiella pneumoniae]ELW9389096.1 hypothetical protein [Klebsiella pneumoniae]KAA1591307.1 hypothetical protein F1D60_26580 [Klebsiella pneumoniae]MBC4184352.1 hypothetical protein [Klebsiella pneumoniae]